MNRLLQAAVLAAAFAVAACAHVPPPVTTVAVCPVVQTWTREELLALADALEWLASLNGPEAVFVPALARAENERRNLREQAAACRAASGSAA